MGSGTFTSNLFQFLRARDAQIWVSEPADVESHVKTAWEQITTYFHRFYLQAYVLNPAYLWRRLRFTIRNRELFWNVYYTMKFWRLLGKSKHPGAEQYRYDHVWRELDTPLDEPLPDRAPPKAKPGGKVHVRRSGSSAESRDSMAPRAARNVRSVASSASWWSPSR